jgi:hypothetical protein
VISTFRGPLPPLSVAVPQIELEHDAFQLAAVYTVPAGDVIVDVGGTVSTVTDTDAVPGDVHERRLPTTRYSYVSLAGGVSSQERTS